MFFRNQILLLYIFIILLLIFLPFYGMDKLEQTKILEFRLDYLFHIFIFLPWAFLKPDKGIRISIWLLAGIGFAATMEMIHWFLPYRSFNVNDLAGNLAGVILGWGTSLIWKLINLKI